jgi:hypothetical protein
VLLKLCFRVSSGNPEVIGFSLSDANTLRVFSLSHLPARLLLLQQPLAFDLIAVRECPQAALSRHLNSGHSAIAAACQFRARRRLPYAEEVAV